jgi:hypothetical protein
MVLQVRSLSDEEVTRMFPQRGQMDLSEYEAIFDGAEPGKGFEVSNEGMSSRALKRRLGQAVKQALGSGYSLRYKKAPQDATTLAFVVKAPPAPPVNAETNHVNGETLPPTRRRRRRVPAGAASA